MLRKVLLISVILFGLFIILIYACNREIVNSSKGKLFDDVKTVPYNKAGLLLGTSKYLGHGYINFYYKYRIEAATELYRVGKIKYIIISGDNGTRQYNEPEMMKNDLIKAGVDSAHIYLDYAGFRTFDSVVRLKEIFGQSSRSRMEDCRFAFSAYRSGNQP